MPITPGTHLSISKRKPGNFYEQLLPTMLTCVSQTEHSAVRGSNCSQPWFSVLL